MKRNSKGKRILAFLVLLLFVQAFGTLAYYYKDFKNSSKNAFNPNNTSDNNPTDDTKDDSSDKTEGSNSTEKNQDSNGKPKRDSQEIIKKINDYISKEKGTYGVYFMDLTGDEAWGINEEVDYDAASTKKVPINLYLYKLISEGKINPNERRTYTKANYQTGTGSIQYKKFGTTYTIKELAKLSITVSDNVATSMLLYKLGTSNVAAYMQSLVNHPVSAQKNVSTPKDMSIYLSELLKFQKDYPTEGDEIIYNLEHTVFNDRIPKYLPKDVLIAHKIGTQIRTINDVGIVYADKPYIICLMSKDIDEKRAPEVLAEISKMIYSYSQN